MLSGLNESGAIDSSITGLQRGMEGTIKAFILMELALNTWRV